MAEAALKQNHVLVFDGGVLTVREGGDGSLSLEGEPYAWDIPQSELIALRDFLNRRFPEPPSR